MQTLKTEDEISTNPGNMEINTIETKFVGVEEISELGLSRRQTSVCTYKHRQRVTSKP